MARKVEKQKYRLVDVEETNHVVWWASMALFIVAVFIGSASLIANVAGVKTWTNGDVAKQFIDDPFLAGIMNWFFPAVAAAMDVAKNAIAIIIGAIVAAGYRFWVKFSLLTLAWVIWAVLAFISVIFMIGTASGIMGASSNASASTNSDYEAAMAKVVTAKQVIASYKVPPASVSVLEAEKTAYLAQEPVNDTGKPTGKTYQQWVDQAGGCSSTKLTRYGRTACAEIGKRDSEIQKSTDYYAAQLVVQTGIGDTSKTSTGGFEVIANTIGLSVNAVSGGFSITVALVVEGLGFFGFLISGIGFRCSKYTTRKREYYTVMETVVPKPRTRPVVVSSSPEPEEELQTGT